MYEMVNEAALSIIKQQQNLINSIIAGIKSYKYPTNYYNSYSEELLIYPKEDSELGKARQHFYVRYFRKVDNSSIMVKSYNGLPYILAKVVYTPYEVRFNTTWQYNGSSSDISGIEEYLRFLVSQSSDARVIDRRTEMGLDGVSEKDVKGTKIYKEMYDFFKVLSSTSLTSYLHPKAIKAVKDRDYIPLTWFVDDARDGLCLNIPTHPIYDYPLNSNKYRELVATNLNSDRKYGNAQAMRRDHDNKELGKYCMEYTPFHHWCIPDVTNLQGEIDENRTKSNINNRKGNY